MMALEGGVELTSTEATQLESVEATEGGAPLTVPTPTLNKFLTQGLIEEDALGHRRLTPAGVKAAEKQGPFGNQ